MFLKTPKKTAEVRSICDVCVRPRADVCDRTTETMERMSQARRRRQLPRSAPSLSKRPTTQTDWSHLRRRRKAREGRRLLQKQKSLSPRIRQSQPTRKPPQRRERLLLLTKKSLSQHQRLLQKRVRRRKVRRPLRTTLSRRNSWKRHLQPRKPAEARKPKSTSP